MTTYYFYKITNSINDEVYIGSTKDPIIRWKNHKNVHTVRKCVINRMMEELGKENFQFKVFEFGDFEIRQDALEREDELIEEYNGMNKYCASSKKQKENKKIYGKKYEQLPHVKESRRLKKEIAKKKESYKVYTYNYNHLESTKQRKREWYLKNKENTSISV